jgi:hypothetical protein
MKSHCRIVSMVFITVVVFCAMIGNSYAAVTITGTSGAKYLVTGMPVTTTTDAVLKIAFENKTAGTNLSLCAGTMADFTAGKCAMPLSDSGGPGFQFLTIVDAKALAGKIIYVIRSVGSADSQFVLTIE